MENTAIRFACNGCGVCCKGRLIPLTFNESREWLKRGHDVAVILEAFDESLWPSEPEKFSHSAKRAAQIDSGNTKINVIAIFAANALTQCPNLDDQDRCGIYEERPLVCSIYPAEISPFITLDPANKVCPPEVWEAGEIIVSDRVVDPAVRIKIAQSRDADRLDAHAKVAICESMDMTVAAWKENALAVYLPDRQKLMAALDHYDSGIKRAAHTSWSVRIEDHELREKVRSSGVQVDTSESSSYIFHKL
ncbi:YkgJ family cysteine cluster protein [Pseudomonas sp. B21-048]|uniref:YkgJ family cysteine cluster protein n=1 Tax=Pseudomonas sp. B21-048 TaxID=2895490 RepID=UPI00215E8F9C|nr:YkgJ family cysteine cluster protein [Pseudomonas sp. B21-048]UVL01141.1 YkgJ family cysteine cluster protein [Pseudomonas sp. B21-048]